MRKNKFVCARVRNRGSGGSGVEWGGVTSTRCASALFTERDMKETFMLVCVEDYEIKSGDDGGLS